MPKYLSNLQHLFLERIRPFLLVFASIIKRTQTFWLAPRNKNRLNTHTISLTIGAIAFILGSYFTISEVLLPRVRALTEVLFTMPTDTPLNATASGSLAGYDDGGGTVFVLSDQVMLATSSAWWKSDYTAKKTVTLKNLASIPLATQSATTQQITVNTKELYDAGTLQANCEDLRVVFVATESANMRAEVPRSYYPASGATNCSDSTATTIAFPLQEPLWANGGTSPNYELYYGNATATDPNYTDQGYSITRKDGSTASATLVCPFNGTTTCVGGETPTTATGAIRYSGGSALSFSGKENPNSYVGVANTNSSLHIEGDMTIESWIRIPQSGGGHILGSNSCWDWQRLAVYNTNLVYANYQAGNYWSQSITYSFQPDQWYHLAVVANRSANEVKFYVDGQLIATRSRNDANWPISSGNDIAVIGKRCNTSSPLSLVNPYSGLLDEVRISNTVRYTSNFIPQTTPFEPDEYTKLLLHFDENGNDPRNTGKAIDSSGNGNHGTITGAKYVSGLVGVDNSSSSTGAIPASTYASHQGVFIEEGTTNLITNPSFENASSATLNWGTNYFNYATASATFTPSMAKRNSAGPFAAGVFSQGGLEGGLSANGRDAVSWTGGSQIAGSLYQNYDGNQGSIVFWITPEWNGNDGKNHTLFNYWSDFTLYKRTDGKLVLYDYGDQVLSDLSYWTAGTTYLVTLRWDKSNSLNGTKYVAVTINDDAPQYFKTSALVVGGYVTSLNNVDGIIEGLTVYRRVLYDGAYGIDVGNGDEIAQIYNSGTGKDPTLVTGSWDVVFALPTNSSTGALTTGTGNAWSHPHASNLLYTSTTNTGGFMMGANQPTDGFSPIGAVADVDSVEFDGLSTSINAGSDSSLDDLPTGDFTVEGWFRLDNWSSNYAPLIHKGTYGGDGWTLLLNSSVGVSFSTHYDSRHMVYQGGSVSADGNWHHYAATFLSATKTAKIFIDGTEVSYGTQVSGIGSYLDDAEDDLTFGDFRGVYNGSFSWIRTSNSNRYTTNFTPPSRFSPPASDANTVAQWNMTDGTGTTVTNVGSCGGVAGNCNGTLSNGTWNQGGALSTNQKIFSGGYKFTSNAANQGIKYTLGSQPVGRDYVVRAVANSDGASIPKIQIWDTVNDHEITQLTGTATSTRTQPNVLLFTFELPTVARNGVAADSTGFEVRLINTEDSGTTYWHQVEVLPNLIDNPSMETGSGDPWIPTGSFTNGGLDTGDSEQELVTVHSGSSSMQYNTGATLNEFIRWQNNSLTIGNFRSVGGWFYGDGTKGIRGFSTSPSRGHLQATPSNQWHSFGATSAWKNITGVYRINDTTVFWAIEPENGASDARFIDDLYMVDLNPVSLTVTPASQANSTETSGLRVDGADTLTQPITGLSADRGVIKFKFTPRHSFSTASSFGVTNPVIAHFYSDSNNYIAPYF